jgi:photosystem II stability/assembly factor-like uncharacterized protein
MTKKILYSFSIAFTLLSLQTNAQLGTWKYQNPSPGPNGQNALEVYSPDTVYVGGWGGYMARTYNGGLTWQECTSPSPAGVGKIEFISGTVGYASGELAKLYKTTNGGNSWTTMTLPNPDWYVGDVTFLTPTVGYMGGFTFGSNGDSSYMAKTTDGGITWVDLPNHKRMANTIARIQTFSEDTIMVLGFAKDYDGTLFSYSHDGGQTWGDVFPLPNVGSENYNQGTMDFINHNEGYLYCTTPDTILKTTDGGITWDGIGKPALTNGIDFFPNTLHYFNSNDAVAFASYGADAIYTSDGGLTWSAGSQSSNTSWIYSMKFYKNSLVGYANGGGGEVLKTTDGGQNWVSVQSPLRSTQWSVDFTDQQNGFSCGNNGSIYKTINGGVSYTGLNSGVSSRLTGIYKVRNTQTLYACGFNGIVLKSTDNGTNWISQTTGTTENLNGIDFKDINNGIAVGANGIVLATSNGGSSWSTLNSGTTAKLNRVKIKGENVYIASDTLIGNQGTFLKSENSGQTFTSISIPDFPESYFGLSFINDSTGYLCGTTGTIIKTTNYGDTWSQTLTNTTDEFFDIEFTNASRGIAVGNYGLIYETNNGGETWEHNVCVINVALYDVSYPDINNAWGAGRAGAMAKYSNNLSTTSTQEKVYSDGKVQLYPNPTNGTVNIISSDKISQIELYNYAGMLIENKTLNDHVYTYSLPDYLSEGIYLIKLNNAKGAVTQRIVLTK